MRSQRFLSLASGLILCVAASAGAEEAAKDSTMVLEGGEEGTAFKSLTVEAENRVQIEFERPHLEINLDPASAPGLEWGSAHDVLDRTLPDVTMPFVLQGRQAGSPYLSRPWLNNFAEGDLARFSPQLEGVERWELFIADSGGRSVRSFSGKGSPPESLGWDGRDNDGQPCAPGLTYSFVLNAYDRAGNERNFVGDAFELPPYRVGESKKSTLLFAGRNLAPASHGGDDPLVLEMASWMNQDKDANRAVVIRVQARGYEQAQSLGQSLSDKLSKHLIGDGSRVRVEAEVKDSAPRDGSFAVSLSTNAPEKKAR